MSNPPFWGDVGVKKWSPFLDSAAQSPIFRHLKIGTFGIFRHIRHIRGVQSLFGQCPNRGAANRNGASLFPIPQQLNCCEGTFDSLFNNRSPLDQAALGDEMVW